MNIHEYQAKELFEKFGVAVPKGVAVKSAAEFEGALANYMRQVMGTKERERLELIQRCQSASAPAFRPSAPPPAADTAALLQSLTPQQLAQLQALRTQQQAPPF